MPLHTLADAAALLPLNTDSYKLSHFAQYPPGTEHVFSYVEARGGSEPDAPDHVVFFGLQMLLKEYVARPVTEAAVEQSAGRREDVATADREPVRGGLHGTPASTGRDTAGPRPDSAANDGSSSNSS